MAALGCMHYSSHASIDYTQHLLQKIEIKYSEGKEELQAQAGCQKTPPRHSALLAKNNSNSNENDDAEQGLYD